MSRGRGPTAGSRGGDPAGVRKDRPQGPEAETLRECDQDLKLTKKPTLAELGTLRQKMTHAEIGHLIGSVFVLAVIVHKIVAQHDITSAVILFVLNVFMNLYPSLLQQLNKRRMDRMIKAYGRPRL